MDRLPRLSLASQIFMAGLAGGVLGVFLRVLPPGPMAVLQSVADFAANSFLAVAKGLAAPMIVSSIILGTAGLEPMRAVGKIVGKSVCWIVLSSLVAVSVGVGAAFVFPADFSHGLLSEFAAADNPPNGVALPPNITSVGWPGWGALVLLSLGFGYYRNQIEEGHARLLSRWFLGVDETLRAFSAFLVRLTPLGVFALATFAVGSHDPAGSWRDDDLLLYKVKTLLLAWSIYGAVALPVALWTFARLNAWGYLQSTLPAVLTAFASGSLEATLPVTLRVIREDAHVSNRVASVTLSLGAAFQREGLAMGCAAVGACNWRAHYVNYGWAEAATVFLTCVLLGCGARGLSNGFALIFLLASNLGLDAGGLLTGLGIGRLVTMGGAAISVWSQACAAAVIAKGEGEFWVPGPPPTPDELQGLKNDLALADN